MGCSCCHSTQAKAVCVDELSMDDFICYCEGVTKGKIIEAVKNGAKNLSDITAMTGACKTAQYCEERNPNKRCCAVDIMAVMKNYQQ